MTGKTAETNKEFLAEMAVRAVRAVSEREGRSVTVDRKNIKLEKKQALEKKLALAKKQALEKKRALEKKLAEAKKIALEKKRAHDEKLAEAKKRVREKIQAAEKKVAAVAPKAGSVAEAAESASPGMTDGLFKKASELADAASRKFSEVLGDTPSAKSSDGGADAKAGAKKPAARNPCTKLHTISPADSMLQAGQTRQ